MGNKLGLALLLWANIAFGQAKPHCDERDNHFDDECSRLLFKSVNVSSPTLEAVDVPAATVTMKGSCWDESREKRCDWHFPSCADKSRILMHSEDGQYWCHKPQTTTAKPEPCHIGLIWPFDDQRDEAEMKVRICMTEER